MRETAPPAVLELLGFAGLVPFAACGVALLVPGEPALAALATRALVGYGCAILSFIGAVHWGLLVAGRARDNATRIAVVATLPGSAGAVAVALPAASGLGLLIIAFGAFWLYEHRSLPAGFLPEGYVRLRRVLTLAVLGMLVPLLLGPVSSRNLPL